MLEKIITKQSKRGDVADNTLGISNLVQSHYIALAREFVSHYRKAFTNGRASFRH